MKAIITKGGSKGRLVNVSQWCNDWFMVEGIHKPLSPSSLMFTGDGIEKLMLHENNGMLFEWYKVITSSKKELIGEELYEFTFKKL